MPKHPHILNAASNLLGIALVIIFGLNATGIAQRTFADEVSWASALLLLFSCVLSYLAMRHIRLEDRLENLADYAFLGGMLSLFIAIIVLAA